MIFYIRSGVRGESTEIEFSRSEKVKLWDIRVEDKAGESIEWEKFNLSEISKITPYYKNGKATARLISINVKRFSYVKVSSAKVILCVA